MVQSGEKEAVAQEAERGLVLARERAEIQNLIFQRQDSLYQRRLISREAFELARSTAQISAIEAAIAEARLRTVQTGAKPEEISMIQSQIEGLEAEIGVLSAQVETLTLVSPFSGIFQSSPGTDTLCTVEDTARVVLMPVPIKHLSEVAPGQSVKLRIPGHTERIAGTLLRLEQRVRIINGAQVMMATASLNGNVMALPSNLIVLGSIEAGRLSPAQYLNRWISDLFR
jgi:multidrug resistance efflux pump